MIGCVFPGQGSQSVGMLSAFAKTAIIQKTFTEASKALGYDLWDLVQNGPEEKLNQTIYTQPALLTASVALWRLWQDTKKESLTGFIETPIVLAGHSLGEYTALVCAESLSLSVAVCLVRERGRVMQAAVPEGTGAMAAILGLTDAVVREICEEISLDKTQGIVEPANYNAPSQVVIAGAREQVLRAKQLAEEKGAKRALLLQVSVPSHCSLMKPAAVQFEQILNEISFESPALPVIHNVDLAMHQEPEEIRKALISQLYRPVRWVETVLKMQAMGVKTIIECGPGKVLTGLNKRIVPNLACQLLTTAEVLCH